MLALRNECLETRGFFNFILSNHHIRRSLPLFIDKECDDSFQTGFYRKRIFLRMHASGGIHGPIIPHGLRSGFKRTMTSFWGVSTGKVWL